MGYIKIKPKIKTNGFKGYVIDNITDNNSVCSTHINISGITDVNNMGNNYACMYTKDFYIPTRLDEQIVLSHNEQPIKKDMSKKYKIGKVFGALFEKGFRKYKAYEKDEKTYIAFVCNVEVNSEDLDFIENPINPIILNLPKYGKYTVIAEEVGEYVNCYIRYDDFLNKTIGAISPKKETLVYVEIDLDELIKYFDKI